MTGFNYFSSVNFYTYISKVVFGLTLAYPLLTAQRRLEAQSNNRPGMIPMRYIGPLHCLGLMFREEGMRGLYRGYTAYILASSIYVFMVPLIAELIASRQPFTGVYDDTDDRKVVQYLKKQ